MIIAHTIIKCAGFAEMQAKTDSTYNQTINTISFCAITHSLTLSAGDDDVGIDFMASVRKNYCTLSIHQFDWKLFDAHIRIHTEQLQAVAIGKWTLNLCSFWGLFKDICGIIHLVLLLILFTF